MASGNNDSHNDTRQTLIHKVDEAANRGYVDLESFAALVGSVSRQVATATPPGGPRAAENYSPELPDIPDPEAKLVRKVKGNGRALLLHFWKRDNVPLDELRAVLHVERKKKDPSAKPPTDKAVEDAVRYLEQKLTEAGCTKTMVEKNGGLYRLSHPQK